MDNFDIRKYITEAKLSEQKKAYIKYEDGSTEDRMFHQSVSDSKIKKMFAPGTFIDGKKVLKVLVGDSLDQPINEAEEGYNEILQWAEENLNFELSPRMLDDIKNILDDGVPVKVIKKMLSDPTGSRLNEEKDVLDPEEEEYDEVPEIIPMDRENPTYYYDEKNAIERKKYVEEKLSEILKSELDPEEIRKNPFEAINPKEVLKIIREVRGNKDLYYNIIDEETNVDALKSFITRVVRKYVNRSIENDTIPQGYKIDDILHELQGLFQNKWYYNEVINSIENYI